MRCNLELVHGCAFPQYRMFGFCNMQKAHIGSHQHPKPALPSTPHPPHDQSLLPVASTRSPRPPGPFRQSRDPNATAHKTAMQPRYAFLPQVAFPPLPLACIGSGCRRACAHRPCQQHVYSSCSGLATETPSHVVFRLWPCLYMGAAPHPTAHRTVCRTLS